MKFEELELLPELKRALKEIGYIEETPIQEQAIPEIIKGKDLIGLSQTGTGKTASYGLPIIERMNVGDRNTQAIILCPTRELAVQVTDELRKFTKYIEGLKISVIYGGQPIERQITNLKSGSQIVVGTPGRVMDHLRRKTLKLNEINMVVLDEADEMLNMGFEEDIEEILKQVPQQRQTILFSATMNPRIMQITKKYLNKPKKIKIEAKELTVENIEQISIEVKPNMKNEAITRIIDVYQPRKSIIFCNTKKKVDDIIDVLKSKKYRAEALHGDVKQAQRDRIMKNMKKGELQILVATDVVARGIDIEDLDLVINYDIPQEEEYYVHRIGRTGRNGHTGKAITFVIGKEKNKLNKIEKYANTKIKNGKIPTLEEVIEIKNTQLLEKVHKIIQEQSFQNTELLDKLVKENKDINLVAKALFTILTQQKIVKKVDNISVQGGNIKLFISLGKLDNIKAKDIIGSISANTAVSGSEIGKIKILDKFSFVEVPQEFVNEILISMKGKQIKGKDVKLEIANN